MSDDGLLTIKYTCKKCGSHDSMRIFPGEFKRPVINCWKCHAGFGMDLADQLNKGVGMFPDVQQSA